MVSKLVSKAIDLYSVDKFTEALSIYKKTLKYDMDIKSKGILYYNIGLCHMSLYNYKAAIVSFKKAFFDFNNKNCGYELCMSYLHESDIQNGMDLYNYRYYGERNMFPNLPIKRSFKLEELKDKKVLVLNEQGYGDEILFSRVIEPLSKICNSSTYQVYDVMIELFESIYKYDNINFFTDRQLSLEFVNSFDTWISVGDLFSSYILSLNSDLLLESNNNFLDEMDSFNKIGVCWKANSESKSSKLRSIDINSIKDSFLFRDKDVYSLQFNECEFWMKSVDISGFKNTYDVINNLDLVVTVDTVTAHLSLLMGKKTILLYDKYIDWRWNFKFYDNLQIVNIKDI